MDYSTHSDSSYFSSTPAPSHTQTHTKKTRAGLSASTASTNTSSYSLHSSHPLSVSKSSTSTNPAEEGQTQTQRTPAESLRTTPSSSSISVSLPIPQADLRGLTPEQRELFQFYRHRLETFEADRLDVINRLSSLLQTDHVKQRHVTQYRVMELTYELTQVQAALAESQQRVFQEQRKNLALQQTIQQMRQQAWEDKKKLAYWSKYTRGAEAKAEFLHKNDESDSQTQQTSQTTEHDKENQVNGKNRPAQKTSGIGHPTHKPSAATAASQPRPSSSSTASASSLASPTTYRTHASAADDATTIAILQRRFTELERQHHAEVTVYKAQAQHLLHDRTLREQQHSNDLRRLKDQYSMLQHEHEEVRRLYEQTLQDYLHSRHRYQQVQRMYKERMATASYEQKELHKRIQHMQEYIQKREEQQDEKTQARKEALHRLYGGTSSTSSSGSSSALAAFVASPSAMEYQDLLQHCVAVEEDLVIIQQQYAATQVLYEQRIRYLTAEYQKAHHEYVRTERRRRCEAEGYTVDIKQMKTQVHSMEETMVRLQKSIQMQQGHNVWTAQTEQEAREDWEKQEHVLNAMRSVAGDCMELDGCLTRLARKWVESQSEL